MRAMIKAFKKLGHEVETCIVGGEVPSTKTGISAGGVQQKIKKMIPSLFWETAKDFSLLNADRQAKKRLNNMLRNFTPDIIYERGYYLMTSGVQVAKKYHIPHALEVNSPFPEERREMSGNSLLLAYARRKERIQIQNTGKLVVVSTALRDYLDRIVP
ncbi:MAG: hypothetical protein D3909_10380, partial [Candidatus Electrothrix sp. ATG1]|nr:hypothetical protein [Candidatus Electrothrix sp. ATG1]